MARMMPTSREYVKANYNLDTIKSLEDLVAESVDGLCLLPNTPFLPSFLTFRAVNIPYNNPVTG